MTEMTPSVEPGVRIYAVGDVHGRADLLEALFDRIAVHAEETPPDVTPRLVMLGDYVDRGPDSRGVLDLLAGPPPAGMERICLKGNHEDFLLRFLDDPSIGPLWFANGGAATLRSYGLDPSTTGLEALSAGLAAALPAAHKAILAGLDLTHVSGDYMFVHAGVDPAVPLDRQRERTLLWIREPFLSHPGPLPRMVVHGHTISDRPDQQAHRIGIDTGAFATGRLTCLVLEGRDRLFLTAAGAPDPRYR